MKRMTLKSRTFALFAVILPLFALFVYVALRSGPLAPVAVTVATVESKPLNPSLFGIGIIEARYSYKIGPTLAGRVKRLDVQVGERVQAGQVLGEMDPVDLDERIRAQQATLKRTEAALRETEARQTYAKTQARRYTQLFETHATSEDTLTTKRQELQIAEASLAAAREDLVRANADHAALVAQRDSLQLISPVDALVTARNVDPGTTVVAGQAVVEVIDPTSLWIDTRFDQTNAVGLSAGLPAHIALRSRGGQILPGRVLRLEPRADPVTEELLVKVIFEALPDPLPPLGELAEVTVELPALPAAPLISNAALQRADDRLGVWQIAQDGPVFTPVKLGAFDLDGRVQVQEGLVPGERVIVYSERVLNRHSRIQVVKHIPGVMQ